MSAADQQDFFRSVELEYWARADGLKPDEEALIGAYLDPAVPTVDAGTGGGRLPRAMRELGFAGITGFDFAPELIAAAKAMPGTEGITYDVADATKLPYPDGSFGQATYLQQVVSTIPGADARQAAMAEAARVLRPGAVALFSFVCLEARLASPAQRGYVAYLRALRRLKRDPTPIQSMPRLRLSGRLDPGALRDRGPYNWWYRAGEAEAALGSAGFEVTAAGFERHAIEGRMLPGTREALADGAAGTLYLVCRRP